MEESGNSDREKSPDLEDLVRRALLAVERMREIEEKARGLSARASKFTPPPETEEWNRHMDDARARREDLARKIAESPKAKPASKDSSSASPPAS
jgi:hypothetical protein